MKRYAVLLLAAFALLVGAGTVEAQMCVGFPVQVKPVGDEGPITVSSTAIAFTVANYINANGSADIAVVTTETNPMRYRTGPTVLNPTAAIGHLVPAGSVIILCGKTAIANFKIIRTSSDAAYYATFFAGN